jgi:hypothetical protein
MKRPTYSDIAKKLSKKKAKFEALSDTFDPAKRFTAQRMVPKYESKLDDLFQVQEMSKSPDGKMYLKKGGKLKYQQGGDGILDRLKSLWNSPPQNNSYFYNTDMNEKVLSQTPGRGNLMDYTNSLGSFGFGNQGAYSDLGINPVQSGTIDQRQTPVQQSSGAGIINQNRRPASQTPGSGGSPGGTFKDANVNNLPFLDQLASMGMPQQDNVADPLAFLNDLGNMGLPQEDIAGTAPAQTARRGFKGADIAGAVGPFMDNLANLINPTPKIPSPRFMSPARMETRFNVAPQINEMRRGMRNFGQSIDRSVGQAGQGAAFKGKALADYFKQTGNILGQKENIEQGLRNQQAQEIARTDNMNQQIASQFDQQQMMRQESERLRRMGMLTNLGEDFMTMSTDRKLRELDARKWDDLMAFFPDMVKDSLLGERFKANLEALGRKPGQSNRYGGKLRMKRKK